MRVLNFKQKAENLFKRIHHNFTFNFMSIGREKEDDILKQNMTIFYFLTNLDTDRELSVTSVSRRLKKFKFMLHK